MQKDSYHRRSSYAVLYKATNRQVTTMICGDRLL